LKGSENKSSKTVAIRDKIAEKDTELTFLQGEVITIVESRGDGVYLVYFLN